MSPSALDGWRQQSSAGGRLLPGAHFMLHPAAAEITAAIMRTLTNWKATRALARRPDRRDRIEERDEP